MSFRKDLPINPSITSGGEKDSTKGFRNLLSNNILNADGTVRFELNPKAIPFVDDYLSKQSQSLENMKFWGQPYFNIYEKILAANNLPVQLKYLSVVESNLLPEAISWAGAVGPWQLMADEAKRFGLKINAKTDERTSYYKSTEAAAKLLKELYGEYGDWLLVIAAYNCGKGGVQRAITKAHPKNFWDLQSYLPEETRNHVKKYIATHYFFENNGGWTTLTAQESSDKKAMLAYLQSKKDSAMIAANTPAMEISGKYNSIVIANTVTIDIAQFNQFNPYFDKAIAEGKTYTLRLPQDKLDIFKAKRLQIIKESVELLLAAPANKNVSPVLVSTK